MLTCTLSTYLHSKCLPAHWVLTCTLSLWTSFSLTICKALERQLWANSLPYFRVNWSATMTSSCTSDCRRGVAQMMLLIGSSRPSSNSLKTSAHGFCLTGIFLCTRRPWVINESKHSATHIKQLSITITSKGKGNQSINQSKQIRIAPCIASESEAHTGRH